MTEWEEVTRPVEDQKRQLTEDLLPLLLALQAATLAGRNTDNLMSTINTRVRLSLFIAGDAVARVQFAELLQGRGYPEQLVAFVEKLAVRKGAEATARAAEIVPKMSPAQVGAYAGLVAGYQVMQSARESAAGAAVAGGATHKMFLRFVSRDAEREHSDYEGTVRPIGGTWLIAGFEVQEPGKYPLPSSETYMCGHGVRYIKRGAS